MERWGRILEKAGQKGSSSEGTDTEKVRERGLPRYKRTQSGEGSGESSKRSRSRS